MAFNWTDERVDELHSLWQQGKSASVIGVRLGVGRGAVLGKVDRLRKRGMDFPERDTMSRTSLEPPPPAHPWRDQRRRSSKERRECKPSFWTGENLERLVRFANEGLKSTQIARNFDGAVTANVVRKKASEIGLRLGVAGLNQGRPRHDFLSRTPPAPPARTASSSDGAEQPHEMRRVPFTELRPGQCKFPLWSSAEKTGACCGNKTDFGVPYCGHHMSITYRPAPERKSDREAA